VVALFGVFQKLDPHPLLRTLPLIITLNIECFIVSLAHPQMRDETISNGTTWGKPLWPAKEKKLFY
jgi:hypothetical protein